MQHDSSSVLAMATNTLHNALCITLNLSKKRAFPLSLETTNGASNFTDWFRGPGRAIGQHVCWTLRLAFWFSFTVPVKLEGQARSSSRSQERKNCYSGRCDLEWGGASRVSWDISHAACFRNNQAAYFTLGLMRNICISNLFTGCYKPLPRYDSRSDRPATHGQGPAMPHPRHLLQPANNRTLLWRLFASNHISALDLQTE